MSATVIARPGIALAVTGLILTVVAACGAAWSLSRLRGTAAGAAVSAACGGVAVTGAALAVLGAVIAHG